MKNKKRSLLSYFSTRKVKNPEPLSLTAEELMQEQADYYNSFKPIITDAKPEYKGEPISGGNIHN